VEEVYDTGVWETVYNVHVAEFHTYFVGSAEWGWAAWAHNVAYLDILARTAQKQRGLIGYIDPESAKGALAFARRSKLSGDHVLPQKAVKDALERYFADRQFSGGERRAIRAAVNEILHDEANLLLMPRTLNSAKWSRNAAQLAELVRRKRKSVDPAYIAKIDQIQRDTASKINNVLNRGQSQARNWFQGFFAGT
jgi:hypothetical protein